MAVSPLSCGRCGAQNPPNQRFCGSCGAALADPLAAVPNAPGQPVAPAIFPNAPGQPGMPIAGPYVPGQSQPGIPGQPGAPAFIPYVPGQPQPGIPVAVPYVPGQPGVPVFVPYVPGQQGMPSMPAGTGKKSIWGFGLTQVLALVIGAVLTIAFYIWGENTLISGGLRQQDLFAIGTVHVGTYLLLFLLADIAFFLSATIGGPWIGPIVSTAKLFAFIIFAIIIAHGRLFPTPASLISSLVSYIGESGMVFLIGFSFAYARRRYGLAFGLSCLAILGGALFDALSYVFNLFRFGLSSSLLGRVIAQEFIYLFVEFLIALALALAGKVIFDVIVRNATTPAPS